MKQKNILLSVVKKYNFKIYKFSMRLKYKFYAESPISVTTLLDALYDMYYGFFSEFCMSILEIHSYQEGVIDLSYESYLFVAPYVDGVNDIYETIPDKLSLEDTEWKLRSYTAEMDGTVYEQNSCWKISDVEEFWNWYMKEPNDNMYVRTELYFHTWDSIDYMQIFAPEQGDPEAVSSPLERRRIDKIVPCII